jgi:hypothetical protein
MWQSPVRNPEIGDVQLPSRPRVQISSCAFALRWCDSLPIYTTHSSGVNRNITSVISCYTSGRPEAVTCLFQWFTNAIPLRGVVERESFSDQRLDLHRKRGIMHKIQMMRSTDPLPNRGIGAMLCDFSRRPITCFSSPKCGITLNWRLPFLWLNFCIVVHGYPSISSTGIHKTKH